MAKGKGKDGRKQGQALLGALGQQQRGNREGAALLASLNGASQGDALLKMLGGGEKDAAAKQGEALLNLLTGKGPPKLQVPMRALILKVDGSGHGLQLACTPHGYKVTGIGKKPGQSGLKVGDVITSVAGIQLGGCSDAQMAERWQQNAKNDAEILVASHADVFGKDAPKTPAPQNNNKKTAPVKTPKKEVVKSKIVGQLEWIVATKDVRIGAKVESPKIEIKGLSGFRLILFAGTSTAPGVDLGRNAQGFSRVLLVPNMTATVPEKPQPCFWPLFATANPSPVPFRLILNGQKSTVLSGTQLWFDFKGLPEKAMAVLAVEVLDSAAEPPDTPDKTLRPDSPAFVMTKKEKPQSQLRADAPAFTPSLAGSLAAQLGIATAGLGFAPPVLSPSGKSGKSKGSGKSKSPGKGQPESPSRRFQYNVSNGQPVAATNGQHWD